MMTTEQIAGLAALVDQATKGPWVAFGSVPQEGWNGWSIKGQPPMLRGFTREIADVHGPQGQATCQANAALIARAPELAADVLRLTATVADLNAANIALVTECARLKAREVEAREAVAPLAMIANEYDEEGLDEARPSWREKGLDTMPFKAVELFSGRGGKQLLTLADAFAARAYLAGGAE